MQRLTSFTIVFLLATVASLTFQQFASAQTSFQFRDRTRHFDLMPIKPPVPERQQFGRPLQSPPPSSSLASSRWQASKYAPASRSDGRFADNAANNGYARIPETRTTRSIADSRFASASSDRQPLENEFSREELVNISVYERSNRSVVNITTRILRGGNSSMRRESATGSGSGFVIGQDGLVLTNYHVVDSAEAVLVTLFDGESYSASLVGSDPGNDIAVLQIDAPASSLYPIELGESSRLRVGQKVFAIGNPFGLERTFTIGILSSKNRTLPTESGRTMKGILQIDAALNRGNSGGPLLNSRGQLIGMNTAIASPSGRGENTGVGFAIPVSTLRRVVPELLETGRVVRPDAGIAHVYETDRGLMVAELIPDGPADSAGLRSFRIVRERSQQGTVMVERYHLDRDNADTIVAVNGKSTYKADEFLEQIESYRPGDRVTIRVIRDDRPMDVTLTLGVDR